jgi:hypothetical protein
MSRTGRTKKISFAARAKNRQALHAARGPTTSSPSTHQISWTAKWRTSPPSSGRSLTAHCVPTEDLTSGQARLDKAFPGRRTTSKPQVGMVSTQLLDVRPLISEKRAFYKKTLSRAH